jgi:hypothetical protein
MIPFSNATGTSPWSLRERLMPISRNHSADTFDNLSYNVTFGNWPNCDSSDVLPKILTGQGRPQSTGR